MQLLMSLGRFMTAAPVRTALWRSFPPARPLQTESVGIDLSEQSVKYAVVRLEGDVPRVVAWGKRSCADALIHGAMIGNPDALVAHLRKIALRTGCREARVSLGEEEGYLFRVAVAPTRSWETLRSQIEFQISENIPLSPSEVFFDALPAGLWEGMLLVDVAAYPRKIVQALEEVFAKAGMRVVSFEIEGSAIARSVLPLGARGAYFLADMGQTEAAVYVVENGHLLFSAKLPVGGEHFSEAIRTAVGESSALDVEELKRTTNLFQDPDTVQSDMMAAACRAAQSVADELAHALQRHLTYWKEHKPTAGYPHAPIERIIAVGGTIRMPGLAPYLSRALGVPIELGDVWRNFPSPREVIPPIPKEEAIQYATAIGLALRDVLVALAPAPQWH